MSAKTESLSQNFNLYLKKKIDSCQQIWHFFKKYGSLTVLLFQIWLRKTIKKAASNKENETQDGEQKRSKQVESWRKDTLAAACDYNERSTGIGAGQEHINIKRAKKSK